MNGFGKLVGRFDSTITAAALALTFCWFSAPAGAATFNFTADGCIPTCGDGPYGAVTVTQDGKFLDFSVSLTNGLFFAPYSGGLDTLVFNLTGVNSATLTASSDPRLSLVAGSFSDAPFTSTRKGASDFFSYAIELDPYEPRSFKLGPDVNAFSFQLAAGDAFHLGNLTLDNLGSVKDDQGDQVYFAADLFTVPRKASGEVGSLGPVVSQQVPAVPEPSTWLLLISGFACLAMVGRRQGCLATIGLGPPISRFARR